MNIKCSTAALMEAVNTVSHAVSGKSTLPALEGILLRASGSSLYLAGYDMELGITTTIEAHIIEEGDIVLSVKLFGDIMRGLCGETVSLVSNDRLNVKESVEIDKMEEFVTKVVDLGLASQKYMDAKNISQYTDIGKERFAFATAMRDLAQENCVMKETLVKEIPESVKLEEPEEIMVLS